MSKIHVDFATDDGDPQRKPPKGKRSLGWLEISLLLWIIAVCGYIYLKLPLPFGMSG